MRRRLLASLVVLVLSGQAHALTVVTVGKQATFRFDGATVRVGKDPAFATLVDPTCAGGAPTAVQLASYLQATWRVASTPDMTLDCAHWRQRGAGYVYDDADGTALGVQRITYGRGGLAFHLGGTHYTPPAGPVGYTEVWVTLGTQRLNVRFHNFRTNTATLIVTRKPSGAAAAGEAAFWDVLHGDDRSEAHEQLALKLLGRAGRDRRDGWSRFLVGMMHLYRFASLTGDFADVPAAARTEIEQASQAFARALPAVWDGQHGDARVPGFIAAATFARGLASGDAATTAAGIADLQAAIAVNPFFNVFDLIPVVQALPRSDTRFQDAVTQVLVYLNAPGNLLCPLSQPEICANDGLAPRNLTGSLLLFGDVEAKAGDLAQAQSWYTLAGQLTAPGYRFQSVVDDRVANGAARVAAYLDADPANDPIVIGTRAEACASCHNR